jgi:hypothetical protein
MLVDIKLITTSIKTINYQLKSKLELISMLFYFKTLRRALWLWQQYFAA